MKDHKLSYKTIDEYIVQFSSEIQEKLQSIREVIKKTAPNAKEKISYQMPTFEFHGNLIHFAAFKKHIGLYPTPSGIEAFNEALSKFKTAKGSIQFPLDQPIPYDLISDIVKFRVEENLKKAEIKDHNVK